MNTLAEELLRYADSDYYPFHMPGHKRRGDPCNAYDITEIDGFDNLHDPEGLIREEMEFAAKFYGTKETYFSVNGSTCGILTAISAAVPKGGRLLIERGCHISVYHAAALRDLHLDYIEDTGMIRTPDAILLTSPTYEGCTKDIAVWAEYARHWNIPLIVDEAHGAHFSMHAGFPTSAIGLGADLVIQSTHKTLPAMTQTALLHNVTGRVASEKLRRYLDIYETSSPSYVLLASMTKAIRACEAKGENYFSDYVRRLQALRAKLAGMKHLSLLGGADAVIRSDTEFPPFREGTVVDPGKIVILRANAISGPMLYDLLRERYHLQPEMRSPDYCLLMTSVADTEEGFSRLETALLEIDASLDEADPSGNGFRMDRASEFLRSTKISIPPRELELSHAMDKEYEILPLREAVGRISADFIVVFPPDSPIIIPGELFTPGVCETIVSCVSAGLSLSGLINDGSVDICVRCIQD